MADNLQCYFKENFMQNMSRHGEFFHLFGILRFFPYIAIGLLIIAVAIWIVFGIKKFKWSKILAIILTVLVVIFGILSMLPIFLGRNITGNRTGHRYGQNFSNRQSQESVQTSSLFNDFKVNNEIFIKI